MISLRLVQQGTQREALTKFYQMPKVPLLKMKSIHVVYLNEKIEIDMGSFWILINYESGVQQIHFLQVELC